MSTKKLNKNKSNKRPARTQRQVSNGYVSRRVPTGMTQIGVADDGTIVYSGTPQIVQQYWPDLYSLRPGASGYVFTGKNGVYTPVGLSNHAYDRIISKQRTSNNLLSLDNLQYVANSGDTSRLPKGYTVQRIPIQTGYGGLTHGWAVYDSNNREVARSNNISYNTQDPADNGLNYLMAGIPAISRYGVTALGNEIAKGVEVAGRAMTPSSYFQAGLPFANAAKAVNLNPTTTGLALDALYAVPAGIAINNAANTLLDSNASLDDKIVNTGEAVLWNLPFMRAEKQLVKGAGNIAKSLRTYPTSNGKVFGFNIGDYAVGLDARGMNAYSGLPVRGGKIIKEPNTLTSLDFGPEFEVKASENTLVDRDIKVGDLIRRSNNEIAYVSKVGERGVTITTKLGDKFNVSKDTIKKMRIDNPEVSRGTVLQIRGRNGDIKEVTATGRLDKFGNIEVLDAQRNRHNLSYDDKVNPDKTTVTSSQNDIILDPDELAIAFLKNLREVFGKTIGTENLSKVRKTISSGVSNFGESVRSLLKKLLEMRATRNLQKPAEALANIEQETLVDGLTSEPTAEWNNEHVYTEGSVLNPEMESYEFDVINGTNPILTQLEVPKNESPQLFNFDGKTYIKVKENINGNPVLRESGINVQGPLRDGYISEPQELTVDKNTFNLHAIPVNENGIPLDVDAGVSYKDSDGITHTIISINPKTGAIKVLNSKTNEVVDSSALDFIKTKRQVEASETLNRESNIGTMDENITGTLSNLSNELENVQDNNSNNSSNNSYSDKTQDLFNDGTFTEGGSSTGNENSFSTEGTSKTLRIMPRYTEVKIDGVRYKIKGNEGNRILLGDPKNNKTIKATLSDLYNSNHAIEVVEGGHTIGWGPLSGNKVNETYTPDTKFKRVPLIFGLKVSPYRQFSFGKDVLAPSSILGIPYGLYELDKHYDKAVNDALLPWKWDVLDKFKTTFEGENNPLNGTALEDSTYNANTEIDYDDIASIDANSTDSTSVSDNNPTLTTLKDANNLNNSSYLGDDDYITSLDYSNERVYLSPVNSDTALAVQAWINLVNNDPKGQKKMLDSLKNLSLDAQKAIIYDYMNYGEGSKKR